MYVELVTILFFINKNLDLFQDSRVAVKSCEGLMLCASLPEQNAAVAMVNDTEFCIQLSQRLVESYLKLPSNVHPCELDIVEAKWG